MSETQSPRRTFAQRSTMTEAEAWEVRKMKRVPSLLVLALFSWVLSGCSRESSAQSPPPESQFVVLNQGAVPQNGISTKKQIKVLSSLAEYAVELANYTNDPPLAIDFTPGRYLLVDMGGRGSGGYSVGVTSVDVTDDSVTANVKLTKPGPTCAVLPVITNPYQFVFIPTLKEVLVSERLEIVNC